MKIVGTGARVIDANLLEKLAVARQSGNSVTKAQAEKIIQGARRELKNEFKGSSAAEITRAQNAVSNTLRLAVDSGWVRAGSTRTMIDQFLTGADDKSLKGIADKLKADLRAPARSGGRGGVSYGARARGGSVSYSSRRAPVRREPAPVVIPPRPRSTGT
jgi:hypothetical protein